MATDVTVRITAKNETRTGYQEALNDAKKFGAEASKSMGPSVDGRGVRGALKGLGADLAQASTPAEAFQAVAQRVAGAFGKITSVVAGFAIGKIIAGQFDKITEAVKSATEAAVAFNGSMDEAAKATTFDGAISGFKTLQTEIDKVGESINSINNDWGAWLANMAKGGKPLKELQALEKSMKTGQGVAISASLLLQRQRAEELVPVAGDKDATGAINRKYERQSEMERLQGAGLSPLAFRNSMQDLLARYAAEDAATKTAADRAQAEKDAKDAEATNKKRTDYNNENTLMDARARGDKEKEKDLLERADFAKALEETGSFDIASSYAANKAGERERADMSKGVFGASSYQRIGFASNEYFDTRRKDDTAESAKRTAKATEEMATALKKPGTLILTQNGQ